jgi:hypothetical protein
MRVVYVGNFGPSFSTESHVAQALEAIGVEVVREQEQKVDWSTLAERCRGATFFLWTSTHDYSPPSLYPAQRQFLADCPVPTVGYHLDIWWSLSREHRVREAPFFQVGLLVTADGGHDDRWVDAGINHRWMPPAVSEFECEPGVERGEFCSPVAFVGSWDGGYHAEHQHREQLVRWLQKRRPDCQFWPKPRQHAVRGEALRDLYASVGVVGDWEALHYLIDHYLAHPDEARQIARQGRRHVLEHHTYTVRMRQLVDLLRTEGLIAKPPGRSRKTPVAA